MAPEFPADLVVLDLRFDGDELVGKVEVIERDGTASNERLHVTWNAKELPKDFFPVAGGAVSVANKPKTIRVDYEVKPDVIGNGRYAWVYNTRTDLMMVIVFPEGYVPDDCEPYPIRAKTFEKRAVAHWIFGKQGAEVRWTMRRSQTDAATEVRQINQKAVRKPSSVVGAVVVNDPTATNTQIIILLGALSLAFLMFLIFFGPRDLPADYKPVIRFIAALTGALLAGFFAGQLNLEGRLPAFAEGIAGNSLAIGAAGGFAVFVFVMLFWAH